MEWFTGWNGYSQPRYNRYTKNTRMNMHCDHIHTLFTTDKDPEPKGNPLYSVWWVYSMMTLQVESLS